jgi:hypothetical protein
MTICSNRSWCVRGVKGFVEISGVGTARELVLVVGTGVDSGVGVTCGRSTEVGEFVVEVRTSAGVSRFLLEVRQTSQTGKTCSRNPIRALKSSLQKTIGLQGWTVNQRSFISGARSLNEQDLHDNLAYFKVP